MMISNLFSGIIFIILCVQNSQLYCMLYTWLHFIIVKTQTKLQLNLPLILARCSSQISFLMGQLSPTPLGPQGNKDQMRGIGTNP